MKRDKTTGYMTRFIVNFNQEIHVNKLEDYYP